MTPPTPTPWYLREWRCLIGRHAWSLPRLDAGRYRVACLTCGHASPGIQTRGMEQAAKRPTIRSFRDWVRYRDSRAA